MRDKAGQVVCGFLVGPDRDLELLSSQLTSRSTSVQALVHSGGTRRLGQLGVTFANTGVLLDFENAYHEAVALNSSPHPRAHSWVLLSVAQGR